MTEEHKSSVISDGIIDDFIEYDADRLLEEYSIEDEIITGKSNGDNQDDIPLKQKRLLTLSNCAAYCAMGLAYGALGPSLESIVERMKMKLADVGGTLFTARGIGWIIGSFIAGSVYERVRGNRLLWITLVILFGFCAATPFVKNFWVLVVMQALQGAVMSWVEVGVNTLTVWIWKEKVSPYMQLLHFAFGLGLSTFPMIAAIATGAGKDKEKAFEISYWAMAIFVLLTCLFPFLLKSPPIEKGITEHTPVVKSNNRAVDKDKSIKPSTESSQELKQKMRYYLIVACITVFLLIYGGAENAFGGWAASYAQEYYKMPEVQADELDSVFWVAITIGRLLSVPLAAKVSTRILLAFDLGGGLITIVLLTFLARFKIKILLWICTIVLGLCMASIYGAAFTVPTELRVKLSGKAAGAFIVAAGIGDVGIPPLVGLMMRGIGDGALVYTLVGLLGICVLVYIVVYSYGFSTMEKRLDDLELQELSQLDDQWAFSYVPLIGKRANQSPEQSRLEFS